MSEWHIKNEAFIWTSVGNDAYLLFRFNQSKSGIFIVFPNGDHLSIHADGYSCFRLKGIPDFPFQLLSIKDSRIHLAQTVYSPLFAQFVLENCHLIPRPRTDSGAIFADLAQFPEGKHKLVLETWFYEHEARVDMPGLVALRPFELVVSKEYPLDDHRKLLGVYLYRTPI